MPTDTHPVDQLDQAEFDYAAGHCAEMLRQKGHAVFHLEPGDATRYTIVLAYPMLMGGDGKYIVQSRPLWMATSFGGLYQVNTDMSHFHWDYVLAKWVDDPDGAWTARVLTRFLNTLLNAMKGAE